MEELRALFEDALTSTAGEHFDEARFIAAASEHVRLSELRDFTSAQITARTSQLVHATNRDYSAFITLSTALEGTHSALLRLRAPTASAVQSLHQLQSTLQERDSEHALSARAAASSSARVRAAELYVAAAEALGEAERLLQRSAGCRPPAAAGSTSGAAAPSALVGGSGAVAMGMVDVGVSLGEVEEGGGPADSASSLLSAPSSLPPCCAPFEPALHGPWARAGSAACRAATGVRRAWIALVDAGEALNATGGNYGASGQGLRPDVIAATRKSACVWVARALRPALEEATLGALRYALGAGVEGEGRAGAEAPLPPALLPLHALLLAWTDLGPSGPSLAEDVVVEGLLAPALRLTLTPTRFDEGGSKGSLRGVPRALDEAVGAALTLLAPFLRAAQGLPGFAPITRCAWAPIVALLTSPSALVLLANPSVPPAFHMAYTAISASFARLRLAAGRWEDCTPPQGYPSRVPTDPLGGEGSETRPPTMLSCAPTASLAAIWAPKLTLYAQLKAGEVGARLGKGLGARVEGGETAGAVVLTSGDVLGPGIVQQPSKGGEGEGEDPAAAALARLCAFGTQAGASLPSLPPSFTLRLSATSTAWACLSSSWAPATFLPPLLPPTAALCIAVLGRYGAWAAAGAAVAVARGSASPALRSLLGLPHLAAPAEAGHAAPPPLGSAGAAAAPPSLPPLTCFQALAPLPPAWTRGLAAALTAAPLTVSPAQSGAGIAAAGLATRSGGGADSPGGGGLSPAPLSRSITLTLSPAETDVRAWGGEGPGRGTGPTVDALLAAAADVGALADGACLLISCRGLLAAGFGGVLTGAAEEAGAARQLAALLRPLGPVTAALHALRPLLHAAAEASVARACAALLTAGVRSVPTAIRVGSGGSAPRAAARGSSSHYVATVFKPLWGLLGHPLAPVGEGGLATACAVAVAVLSALAEAVAATLAGVTAMEASLSWLKPGAGSSSSSAAPTASDGDRICAQLWADVAGIGREVAEALSQGGCPLAMSMASEADGSAALALVAPRGEGSVCVTAVVQAFGAVAAKVRPFSTLACTS